MKDKMMILNKIYKNKRKLCSQEWVVGVRAKLK